MSPTESLAAAAMLPLPGAPSSAAELVIAVLDTEDLVARAFLIDSTALPLDEQAEAARQLIAEAERLSGIDPTKMERVAADAGLLAVKAGDSYLQSMALFRFADALRFQRRHREAASEYTATADQFAILGKPIEAARARGSGLALVIAAMGRPEEALIMIRKVRRVLAAHQQTWPLAALDLNAGVIFLDLGRDIEALRCFGRALKLFRSLGSAAQVNIARCHLNQSIAKTRLGRYREAEVELQLAREAYPETGESADGARIIRLLGEHQMSLGRYSAALTNLQEAQDMLLKSGAGADAATVAKDIADCYLQLGRPAEALACLDQTRTPEDDVHALALVSRRVAAYLLLDEHAQALAVLEDAKVRYPTGSIRNRAWLALQRASVSIRDGDIDEALAAASDAQALAHESALRPIQADALIVEGIARLKSGAIDAGARAAQKAHRLAMTLDAAPIRYRAQELMGMTAEARQETSAAMRHYASALTQLEREQRGVIFEFRDSFASSRSFAYERLASLQVQSGDVASALGTAERAKSRALVDAIGGTLQLRPRGNAKARRLMEELSETRQEYAAGVSQLQGGNAATPEKRIDLSRHVEDLETRIAATIQKLQMSAEVNDSLDLVGASLPRSTALPPDTAMLEFYFSGDDVLRFFMTSDSVQGEVLTGAVPNIERLVRTFRLNISASERASPQARAVLGGQARAILRSLHDILLGGLSHLEAFDSLVIVPHGVLHYLPMHALYDGHRYLVERHRISYAPSSTVYDLCRARKPGHVAKPLVLANSASGQLPFVIDEAEAVGAVLGVDAFTESLATRDLLERDGRDAGIIHIAAHGQFRPDVPLFSAIQLADGPLTAADIFGLEMRASLVTLSACETGRGALGGGDELIGLTRAFLYAGAAGLLVSQWRVEDSSTSELMSRFYTELAFGKGTAAALRLAQLEILQSELPQTGPLHPFYWAGFQIVGDDRKVDPRARV